LQFRDRNLLYGELSSEYVAIGNVEQLGWPSVPTRRSRAWSDDHASQLPLFARSVIQ